MLARRLRGPLAAAESGAPAWWFWAGLALLMALPGRVLLVQEPSTNTPQLREAISYTPLIEALPEVKAVSPQITGAGFVRRGTQVAQVSVVGLEPGRESAILNLDGYLVQGDARLRTGAILLGRALAEDLGLSLGQTVEVQSQDGIAAALTVTGLYQIGSGGPDRRMAYVSLTTARRLFEMPQGVGRIEIKLFDLYAADAVALRVEGLTGLDAKSWTEDGAQLLEALNAQAQTGYFLKTFAMITIIIGVASALLLSTYRRRPEIGIMRAMGAPRWFVLVVFVSQGALIGLGALCLYLWMALLTYDAADPGWTHTSNVEQVQNAAGRAVMDMRYAGQDARLFGLGLQRASLFEVLRAAWPGAAGVRTGVAAATVCVFTGIGWSG